MNPFTAAAIVILLLLIRIAVPCAVVGGLCFGLDRLFQRWDAEAQLNEV